MPRRFKTSERGSVATTFCMCTAPLVLAAGLAVDYGRYVESKGALQGAVDAAALALGEFFDATPDIQVSQATRFLDANGKKAQLPSRVDTVTAGPGGTLTVTSTGQLPMTLMAIVTESMTVTATATVQKLKTNPACIFTLEPSANGLYVDSNGLLSANCGVWVNSRSASAVRLSSQGRIIATSVDVVGSAKLDGGASISPSPIMGSSVVPDPLASLPVPPEAADPCTATNTSFANHATATLSPGVYCGGIVTDTGVKLKFAPGIYVMRDGPLRTSSGTTLTGDGVMFYFTGSKSKLFIDSNSSAVLSAPTSGTYKGILFFQERNSTASLSQIDSGNVSKLTGAVYFPSTELHLDSSSSTQSSADWTVYVVRRLNVDSATTLNVNWNPTGSSVPLPDALSTGGKNRIRLIN